MKLKRKKPMKMGTEKWMAAIEAVLILVLVVFAFIAGYSANHVHSDQIAELQEKVEQSAREHDALYKLVLDARMLNSETRRMADLNNRMLTYLYNMAISMTNDYTKVVEEKGDRAR